MFKPQGAWLTTNRLCNFRCKWCYAIGTAYKKAEQMSLAMAVSLLDIIRDLNIKDVILIGGEPTLWQPLFEVSQYCKKNSLKTILVTNGYCFGIDSFWEKYQQMPCDIIGLSLKAHTPEMLKEVAGVRNFKIFEKGFTRITEKTDNYGVSITYNKFYQGRLPEMTKWAVDYGAKSVKIEFCSTIFINGQPDNRFMVEPEKIVSEILADYNELDQLTKGRLLFEMNLPFCLWPKDFIETLIEKKQIISVCHLLKNIGVIFDIDGKLIMCNALFDYPLGQYQKDFSDAAQLVDFLNNPANSRYYKKMTCYPSEICADCSWYSKCGGGCPLRWALYKPEHLIKIPA